MDKANSSEDFKLDAVRQDHRAGLSGCGFFATVGCQPAFTLRTEEEVCSVECQE